MGKIIVDSMENINVDQRNGNIQSLFGSQLPLCKGELEGNLDRDDFPSLVTIQMAIVVLIYFLY